MARGRQDSLQVLRQFWLFVAPCLVALNSLIGLKTHVVFCKQDQVS